MTALLTTAAGLGFIHTVIGPDHYLPFVAMAKARDWSFKKALTITAICGVGHVLGSIILGLIGVAFGIGLSKLEGLESIRGDLAAYGLIAFGLVYFIWGIRKAYHGHSHSHIIGGHKHPHPGHHHGDREPSGQDGKTGITPWVLFTIFVFGPCEVLIPILMYPEARNSTSGMLLVAGVFAVATIGTMLISVAVILTGLTVFKFRSLERFSHALAGFALLACGLAIFFGL